MMARIAQQLKASRYSKVFSLVLKTVTDVPVRMSAGLVNIGWRSGVVVSVLASINEV